MDPEGAGGVKILVVSIVCPWPEDAGARMRAGQTVRALTEIGDIDCYLLASRDRIDEARTPPSDLPLRRLRALPRPSPPKTFQRLAWIRPGGAPRKFAAWDGVRSEDLRAWADRRYDAVWVIRAGAYGAVRPLDHGPVIVDLDDLEDRKAFDRARVERVRRATQLRLDGRRWERRQREIAREVETVVVCSELDRERVGVPNAEVIPNGYASPWDAPTTPRPAPNGSPLILLQGSLNRPPLYDAASVLVRQVLPRVRAVHSNARVALVGLGGERIRTLGREPGVQATGWVPSMRPWLEEADLVAVPMRWGSGTRIKILEAFAHGIPVVSSSIGAEGLDAIPGEHLLIEDDPARFADACLRMLSDVEMRSQVTLAARRLWEERYRWEPIQESIGRLVTSIADRAAAGRR